MNIKLIKADMALFAIYQTIYSNADIEMWFSWNERLEDTKWATDQCYFLELDGKKIGGAVITDEFIINPFLIPPFIDGVAFWKYLLKLASRPTIYGALSEDREILTMFDYTTVLTKQIMVCPSDRMETTLPTGFICRVMDVETEIEKVAQTLRESFLGGIVYEKTGEQTLDQVVQDIKDSLEYMNVKNFSFVIIEIATNKIVGACIAGVGEKNPLGYNFVNNLGVLPEYQGKGLAKHLVSCIVTASHGVAPFVKLCVVEGNSAELLYRQLGFKAGERFSDLKQRK